MWCDGVTLSVWIAEGRMTVGEAVSKQSGFPDCPVASGIPEEVAMEREATEADEAPEERGSDGAREAGMPWKNEPSINCVTLKTVLKTDVHRPFKLISKIVKKSGK